VNAYRGACCNSAEIFEVSVNAERSFFLKLFENPWAPDLFSTGEKEKLKYFSREGTEANQERK